MADATITRYGSELVKATGKNWEEWFQLLDQAGAREMPREEIKGWLASEYGLASDNGSWIAIIYERHIGRLVKGQDCYGNFYATASKAIAGDLDYALDAWLRVVNGAVTFNGVPLAGDPKVSSSEKYRYWRANFADESTMSVVISIKSPDKSTVAVDHRKLESLEAVEEWKAYWKGFLANI